MTTPQKPEWLKPKGKTTSRLKILRGIPVLAFTATATFIGVGTIFAQPQEVIVAHTTGSVAVLNTAPQDSTVTPPILEFPAVGTLSDDANLEFPAVGTLIDDDDDDDDFDDDDDDDFADDFDDDFADDFDDD